MQLDIRTITRDSVAEIMATETTMQGANMGSDPSTGQPVLLRSGRFGRFLQIGADVDKNKTAHSLPRWVDDSISLPELLAFSLMPTSMGPHTGWTSETLGEGHPLAGAHMMLDVTSGSLTAGVERYPYRVTLPDGLLVSQATPELVMSLLTDPDAILDSQRLLGCNAEGEDVFIRKGRFGHYARAGKIIAGLRKLDPAAVTLQEAIDLLQTRGKPMGSKRKKKAKPTKEPKATGKLPKLQRRKNAYQIYASDMMRSGKKLAEIGPAWKALAEGDKQIYAQRAVDAPAPTAEVNAAARGRGAKRSSATNEAKGSKIPAGTEKNTKKPALSITDAVAQIRATAQTLATPRRKSGYAAFASDKMKGGMKMAAVAAEWRLLGEAEKQDWKARAENATVVV